MEINRRKFMAIFGTSGIGAVAKLSNETDALNISVNRFENNKKVSLQNMHSAAIKIEEADIISNNLDYNKNAVLSVYATVEDQDVGKVKTKSIDIQSPKTELNNIIIHIDEPELFKDDNYSSTKTSIDIDLRLELDHPSIKNTITENITYKLNISASGELESHTHKYYNNFNKPSSQTLDSTKVISGSNLPTLKNKSGLEQVKILVSGGPTANKSSYNMTHGVVDSDDLPFLYSSPRDGQIMNNTKESNAESVSGSDLNVLTSKSGLEQVKILVSGGPTVNKSSYDMTHGVVDSDDLPFLYSSPRDNQIMNNIRKSKSESISGSDLNVLTSKSGLEQVKILVSGGPTANKSSYDMTHGVVDSDDLPFLYSSPRDGQIMNNTKESNAESISGSDLNVLTSKSGLEQVKILVSGGSTANKSSYDMNHGVVDSDDLPFLYSSPRDNQITSNDQPSHSKYHLA